MVSPRPTAIARISKRSLARHCLTACACPNWQFIPRTDSQRPAGWFCPGYRRARRVTCPLSSPRTFSPCNVGRCHPRDVAEVPSVSRYPHPRCCPGRPGRCREARTWRRPRNADGNHLDLGRLRQDQKPPRLSLQQLATIAACLLKHQHRSTLADQLFLRFADGRGRLWCSCG